MKRWLLAFTMIGSVAFANAPSAKEKCRAIALEKAISLAESKIKMKCWFHSDDNNGPPTEKIFYFNLVCSNKAKDAKSAEKAEDKNWPTAHVPVDAKCAIGKIEFSTYD